MNVIIQAIQINQINQINNYRLSAFPEDRIKNLISELNVHYDKINNYIESEISGEKINVELIDSLAKLNEISRLAPFKINTDPYSGDYRFTIDLLDSVIALLQCGAGNSAIRNKFNTLGWELLRKLYNYSFDALINESLAYNWLKSKKLINSHSIDSWYPRSSQNDNKIKFEPTEQELESFYEDNKQKLYEYMVFDLNPSVNLSDPFSEQEKQDFYHYYQTLKQIKI